MGKNTQTFLLYGIGTYSVSAGKSQDKHAAWDTLQQSIIYLHGTDTIFSLPFDKTFYAQLNHEKKKKRKTIRYRVARYARPTEVEPIPVVITNNNTLLYLRGNLQGDTTAVFFADAVLTGRNARCTGSNGAPNIRQ